RRRVTRLQPLAAGHEQAVPFRAAKADVAADLGQPDAANQLAGRIPDRDAAVAHGAAGIARAPEVTLHVGAHAVGSAFHAVDHEIAEELLVGELVVAADVERVHVALAARARVTGAFPGADHVELLVVGREAQPVWIRHLRLGHDQIHLAGRIDAIHAGRQLALVLTHTERLAQSRLQLAARIARSTGSIGCAL